MAEIALYAKDKRLVTEAGALLPTNARPIVRWREQDTFTLRLADGGEFPEGAYHYAFDIDRDFLHTPPCNTGSCEITGGALVFTVTFNAVTMAEATNGRRNPLPFYIQITRDGSSVAEYIIDDAIWAAGCVWDGRIPPAPEAPNYYTKAEVDGIAERKLDKPEEAGEEGYVLGLAEDGSTAWIPNGGGGSWGSITGDLSSQTDLADALDKKANLVQGKVPASELSIGNATNPGALSPWASAGIGATASGMLFVNKATNGGIDAKESNYLPIVPNSLDYAVRSVLPNVTTIPAATSSYSLVDASATTNAHSWTYVHQPSSASTYVFPAVTDATTVHRIDLIIDFTDVQTYSFEDSEGNALTPLFTPTIAAGDVYEFDCEYSAVKGAWLIWPHKQGAVSDDYVMQSQVGAANGVAGLDGNALVPSGQLPIATANSLGAVRPNSTYGTRVNQIGEIYIYRADETVIDNRETDLGRGYRPIVPNNLNYAVTAALTDSNKIQLTDAQKASAQDTLGVGPAPLILSVAPTTSTVGVFGQHAIDTTTGKEYTCQGKTNAGTEEEPVWSYMWVDDVNAYGGRLADGAIEYVPSNDYYRRNGYNYLLQADKNGANLILGQSSGVRVGGNVPSVFPRGYSYSNILAGKDIAVLGDYWYYFNYNIASGRNITFKSQSEFCSIFGFYNVPDLAFRIVGNGAENNCRNAEELSRAGDLYIAGGHQQGITTIPAATSAYTLTEGVQSHAPSAASTYTLPAIQQRIIADGQYFTRNTATDGTGYYGWLSGTTNRYTASSTPSVGDNAYTNTALTAGAKAITAIDERTHECILTVRFSASVLTYAFEDSAGNTLTPLPLAGTIQDGSVVCFRCTWEALLGQWVIMPVMLGTYQEVEP